MIFCVSRLMVRTESSFFSDTPPRPHKKRRIERPKHGSAYGRGINNDVPRFHAAIPFSYSRNAKSMLYALCYALIHMDTLILSCLHFTVGLTTYNSTCRGPLVQSLRILCFGNFDVN
ncbi:hypothetical protein BDR05DRAFT_386026 [Suillus weaverae]|nr:hypothetical protein BDR05DRAFT_386026 [Suillus weaverae]